MTNQVKEKACKAERKEAELRAFGMRRFLGKENLFAAEEALQLQWKYQTC